MKLELSNTSIPIKNEIEIRLIVCIQIYEFRYKCLDNYSELISLEII